MTLAVGIGANTAMFAVVSALLLKPLPFRDAERLMLVHLQAPDPQRPGAWRESVWSYPKYRALLEFQETFESTALFSAREFALSDGGEPERIRGEVITDRYPAILGIAPFLGRLFTEEEAHRPGSQPVALMSHALWSRRYGGHPAIIGRTIEINATAYAVVGVLPPGFRGLNGNAEIWVPLAVWEPVQLADRAAYSHSYSLIARRTLEATEQSAISAVRVYGARIDTVFPEGFPDRSAPWGATAVSLHDSRADGDVRLTSVVLLGAVAFVLLIACLNLTNLFVTRALARGREIAVRAAVGGSRLRIARQVFIEALLLTASGAVVGLIIADGLLRGAAALLPESDVFFRSPIAPGVSRLGGAAGLTRISAAMIGLDWPTLFFTCAIAVLAGALIALVPALTLSSPRSVDLVKGAGGPTTASGFGRFGTRAWLVTVQISLALVLLTGAGLMLKSAFRLQATDIGIDPENVLTARLVLPPAAYNQEKGGAFFLSVADVLRAVPGVESVAFGNCAPVSGGCNSTSLWFPRQGERRGVGVDPLVGVYWATPDYFAVLKIQLIAGRGFTEQDRLGRPKVVLVNEAAARALWPNDTPVGKIVAVGQGGFHEDEAEVIGVVSNVRYQTIEAPPRADVYLPLAQSYQGRMLLFVRSRTDPGTLAASLRHEVGALDPTLPLSDVKTMQQRLGDAIWRTRVATWLFSVFAALALLLTAIGVFGVMAQTVSQRTPEIGLRMALGAHARDVLQLVVMRAMIFSVIGIGIGILLALGLSRFMTALLYQVEPHDRATLVTVAVLVWAVSLMGCFVPALCATRVNPAVALRAE
jgi:putative ABC transport system permease protein